MSRLQQGSQGGGDRGGQDDGSAAGAEDERQRCRESVGPEDVAAEVAECAEKFDGQN